MIDFKYDELLVSAPRVFSKLTRAVKSRCNSAEMCVTRFLSIFDFFCFSCILKSPPRKNCRGNEDDHDDRGNAHATLSSGYKRPVSDISGYLSMICLAKPLDTCLWPVRICETSCLEQLSNIDVTSEAPPAININRSNSLFMGKVYAPCFLISINICKMYTNRIKIVFVRMLYSCFTKLTGQA